MVAILLRVSVNGVLSLKTPLPLAGWRSQPDRIRGTPLLFPLPYLNGLMFLVLNFIEIRLSSNALFMEMFQPHLTAQKLK